MFKNTFCHWYFRSWRVLTFVLRCQWNRE
jgi:hypothetical protein